MSCSPAAITDYVLGELGASERKDLERHVAACTACREELERTQLTRAAMFSLPDEEMPRRIAFVSDKVLEPKWWQVIWNSGPKLAFAGAAMLAMAVVAHGVMLRPQVAGGPVVTAHGQVDPKVIEARVQQEIERRMPEAVKAVAAEMEKQQEMRVEKAVAAVRKKYDFERSADMAAVEANFNLLRQQMNRMYVASNASPVGGQ